MVETQETLKIAGTDQKVKKNALVLNQEKTIKILVDVLETLMADEKFIAAMDNLGKDEGVDTKQALEETLKEVLSQTPASEENTVTVAVYTKGFMNDFVGFEIIVEDNYGKQTLLFTVEVKMRKSL